MKRHKYFLSVFTLLLIIGTGKGFAQQDTLRLRIMTYNLRFGERASLEELAEVIRQENPDLVALQEMDCNTRRPQTPHQHGKNFATELGYHTGMFPLFGQTIHYAGGYYGIGILSRFPYSATRKVMLSKGEPQEEQRALLLAVIPLETGDTIIFASTHLDHRKAATRMIQTREVVSELQKAPYSALVGGDFNARPGSTEIQFLCQQAVMLGDTVPTVPADQPRNRIDYLFGFPAGHWELESTRVIASDRSDHRPVVSVVRLIR